MQFLTKKLNRKDVKFLDCLVLLKPNPNHFRFFVPANANEVRQTSTGASNTVFFVPPNANEVRQTSTGASNTMFFVPPNANEVRQTSTGASNTMFLNT